MRSLLSKLFLSFVLLILAVFCFDGPAVSVQAGNLTIKVLNTSAGVNLAGASVCYNSADRCSGATGASLSNGNFVFQNVPAGSVTVNASKAGFIGRTLTFKMTSSDLLQQIILQPGTGPLLICPAPPFFPVANLTIQSVKINEGAASTTNRAVTLTITTNGGAITAFRATEPEGGLNDAQTLQQKPFIPLGCTSLSSTETVNHTLLLRRSLDNKRYSGRAVTVQVKSGPNTSNMKLDAIQLDPVLRDYTLTGSTQIQQVLDFSAANGFQHTLPAAIHISTSACLPSQLFAEDSARELNLVRGFFFQNRPLNPFWNIRQVTDLRMDQPIINVPPDPNIDVVGAASIVSSVSEISQDVFRLEFRVTMPRVIGPFNGSSCWPLPKGEFRKIVISGPNEDDFLDATNPWKNAFVQSN